MLTTVELAGQERSPLQERGDRILNGRVVNRETGKEAVGYVNRGRICVVE
jgi:hypothetical protein